MRCGNVWIVTETCYFNDSWGGLSTEGEEVGTAPLPRVPTGGREWPGHTGAPSLLPPRVPGAAGPPRAAHSQARPKGGMRGGPRAAGSWAGCARLVRVQGGSGDLRAGDAGGHPELPDPWAQAGPCEAGLSPAHGSHPGEGQAPPGSVPDTSPHVIPSAALFHRRSLRPRAEAEPA